MVESLLADVAKKEIHLMMDCLQLILMMLKILNEKG